MPTIEISTTVNPKGKLLIWKKEQQYLFWKESVSLPAGSVTFCTDFAFEADTYNKVSNLHASLKVTYKGQNLSSRIYRLSDHATQISILELGPETLSGMYFNFTGGLSRNRGFYKSLVQSHSGVFQTSVTDKTTHIVARDINTVSAKMKKAKDTGKIVISEQMFMDLMNGRG